MDDFSLIPSVDARAQKAITALQGAGMSLSAARSITAVAMRESGAIFSKTREATLPYDHSCWPARELVGLEVVVGTDPQGNRVQLFRHTSANDQTIANWLLQKGYAKSRPDGAAITDGNGNAVVSGPVWLQPTGDMAGNGTTAHALFFEWVLGNRVGHALDMFSIGPTMMWLGMSGEAVRAGLYAGKAAGYPDTWDDIWKYYLAQTYNKIIEQVAYLSPAITGLKDYPADHPNDDAANLNWLTHQVGHVGTNVYYANFFKPNLLKTLQWK